MSIRAKYVVQLADLSIELTVELSSAMGVQCGPLFATMVVDQVIYHGVGERVGDEPGGEGLRAVRSVLDDAGFVGLREHSFVPVTGSRGEILMEYLD